MTEIPDHLKKRAVAARARSTLAARATSEAGVPAGALRPDLAPIGSVAIEVDDGPYKALPPERYIEQIVDRVLVPPAPAPSTPPATEGRSFLGFRFRKLNLTHDGRTFLRRRGIEHPWLGGILIHWIDGPDPGLDVHDHPWEFVSVVLRGGYTEEAAMTRLVVDFDRTPRIVRRENAWTRRTRVWRRWSIHRMGLDDAHRITAAEPGTITLVLRRPKVRTWGFFAPTGWVDWESYDYEARRPCGVASNHPEEVR